MESEKKHNDGEQHEIDQYFKNAVIENESEYPELKSKRENDKRLFEQIYPDAESRYKGALAYLGGDFFNVFAQLTPPAPEEGEEGWRFIHPVDTLEERYSQHPRFPLYVPILLKAAPEEVREQNHLVRRMNEAVRKRNSEEINKIREEARAFMESIRKKSAEIQGKK